MEKLKKILFITFSMFLGSCHSSTQKATVKDGIIHINILENYPSKKINLKDIADIEYVPLETTNDVLLDQTALLHYVSKNYILLIERNRGNVYLFDRNGKVVSHFNHRGGGPEEYLVMSSVVFDEKNEEIFVFSDYGSTGTGQIIAYSFTGEFKRSLKYPADLSLKAYNFDDETMLVYDSKYLYRDDYSKMPYMFLSKRDGNITSILNISLSERYDNRVYFQTTDASGQLINTGAVLTIPNKLSDGQDFVIADVSSDTIYWLSKNGDLKPFIVTTPSVHSTNPHVVCTHLNKTDKYILLFIIPFDYVALRNGETPSGKTLMYEFKTGKIYNVNNFGGDTNASTVQKNIEARLIDAEVLRGAFDNDQKDLERLVNIIGEEDKNKLFKGMEQFIVTLGEEDNPVVMIMKYQ